MLHLGQIFKVLVCQNFFFIVKEEYLVQLCLKGFSFSMDKKKDTATCLTSPPGPTDTTPHEHNRLCWVSKIDHEIEQIR